MSERIIDLTKQILERESAKRRQVTASQIEALILKYKPGGKWRLLQPGPNWEACQLYIAELRDVGQATVEELLRSGALPAAGPAEVEKVKHIIFDWIAAQRDGYVRESLTNFLQARGTLVQEELTLLLARVAEELAQVTKDLLIRISESAEFAKAGKK